MCCVGHCRVLVSGLGNVVVCGEDLGEGVADLDTSVETYTLINGTIESHQEPRVLVVVAGDWGGVEVVETCIDRLKGIAGGVEPVVSVSESEPLSTRLSLTLIFMFIYALN